ncbi:unnamed protein product [Parnassius apollo]|uniref:(apollo) hypothetical protein n=1 Tax=Parnassius apollo TaxID=110799 RepID=A0A8S3Y2R1_PARAO|nr:unnamed protein product [Parnassius apollo]
MCWSCFEQLTCLVFEILMKMLKSVFILAIVAMLVGESVQQGGGLGGMGGPPPQFGGMGGGPPPQFGGMGGGPPPQFGGTFDMNGGGSAGGYGGGQDDGQGQ